MKIEAIESIVEDSSIASTKAISIKDEIIPDVVGIKVPLEMANRIESIEAFNNSQSERLIDLTDRLQNMEFLLNEIEIILSQLMSLTMVFIIKSCVSYFVGNCPCLGIQDAISAQSCGFLSLKANSSPNAKKLMICTIK